MRPKPFVQKKATKPANLATTVAKPTKSAAEELSEIDTEIIGLRKQELSKIDDAIDKLVAKKKQITQNLAAAEAEAKPKVETLAKKIEEKEVKAVKQD